MNSAETSATTAVLSRIRCPEDRLGSPRVARYFEVEAPEPELDAFDPDAPLDDADPDPEEPDPEEFEPEPEFAPAFEPPADAPARESVR